MDAIRGFVYRTIYENTQRTYCVFILKDYNEEYITCTGKFESPKEGEDIEEYALYHHRRECRPLWKSAVP